MLRSFHRLTSVDPGFQTARLLTMDMVASPTKYPRAGPADGLLLPAVRRDPRRSRRAGGRDDALPATPGTRFGLVFNLAGEPPPDIRSPGSGYLVVSPGYFQAMGMPLIAGRHFDTRDRVGSTSTIVVNQEFVRQHLAGRDPIGQKLQLCWTVENPVEIVGVVGESRQKKLDAAPQPIIFVNNLQAPITSPTRGPNGDRSDGPGARRRGRDPSRGPRAGRLPRAVDGNGVVRLRGAAAAPGGAALRVRRDRSGAGHGRRVWRRRLLRRQESARDRHSDGARGGSRRRPPPPSARRPPPRGMRRRDRPGGAFALTRLLRDLLFETSPNDPATLAAVGAAILAVVFVATVVPANRAASVDPTVALRHE